ncbi:metallophosphoesterase [Halobacterium sp. NMX12-1]|uniref:Metallophosphoesterase n=1 Tax=Halobacterium sp. NMX12-1 TaxID=3166650 RepID=A0AAU8CCT0_9EURY
MSVEDIQGTRFQVIIWSSSEEGKNCDWKEGHWYRLSGVTANEWPSGTVPHGTSSLGVDHLGQKWNRETVELLYLTDSHLGKTTHSYGGSSWSVSPATGFSEAIKQAIRLDVDAVVHGGDLFHNPGGGIDSEDVSTCREKLTALAEAGIPFYFIYGNHERQAGRQIMERFADNSLAVHLGPRYEMIGDMLAVYGIDHQSDWTDFVPDVEQAPDDVPSMLCVHQSLDPFTESVNPDCSVQDLKEDVDTPIDLLVTGHVHTRSKCRIDKLQAFAGGSTARLGESRDSLSPSVELISVTDRSLNVKRKPL